MQLEGVPETFSRDRFNEMLATVGLDPSTLREFSVDPAGIRAVVYALDENGRKFAADDGRVATHTVYIRFV